MAVWHHRCVALALGVLLAAGTAAQAGPPALVGAPSRRQTMPKPAGTPKTPDKLPAFAKAADVRSAEARARACG
ncbi:MAG: hypothetical protein HY901_21560 [Deltaproteobacteria bacterium]|nr:hypothetical protein [Deltaproteobacteria bacterium]